MTESGIYNRADFKPPYKIPSIAEIAVVPKTGMRAVCAVSLFAGIGGSALGLRMAGFMPAFASELDREAASTLGRNFFAAGCLPVLATGDVREISAGIILGKTGMRAGEIDLLEGSPPAASKRADKENAAELIEEFLRLLGDLRPRAFLMETAATLASSSPGKFQTVLSTLAAAGVCEAMARRLGSETPGGYSVASAIVDAKFCGLPQSRERLIFMGVRLDVAAAAGCGPSFPKPLEYQYSLGDACPWLATRDAYESSDDPAKPTPAYLAELDISAYPVGKEAMRLKPGEASGKYHSLVRCSPSRPVNCINPASKDLQTAGPIPPWGCRKFSTAELKRICGFPDDFTLAGDRAEQYGQLAGASSPAVYKLIGDKLRELLKNGTE